MSATGDDNFYGVQIVRMGKEVKECSKQYYPEYPTASPTDLRTFWHSKAWEKDREMAEKITKMRAVVNNAEDHGDACGIHNYTRGKARKQALDAKTLTMAFFGEDMIPWVQLTEEEMEARIPVLAQKWNKV